MAVGEIGAAAQLGSAAAQSGPVRSETATDASSRPSRVDAQRGRSALRRQLVTTDIFMVLPAWLLAPLGPWAPDGVHWSWWLAAPALTAGTVAGLAVAGLYRARVCAVRSTEVVRLAYVSIIVGLLGVVLAPPLAGDAISLVAAGAVVTFLSLLAGRAIYRNWLMAQRATGKLLRNVAIVGADEEAGRLGAHLLEHPEVGYDVIGYFRSSEGHAAHLARPVLGQASDAPAMLRELEVDGAIVVPGALEHDECDDVITALLAARVHVHLATGLRGIDSRRLRSSPMGHEPLLYIEPAGMNAPWYSHLKRVIDVVGATVALTLAAPLYVMAAIAIKVTDGGPVLFRQERCGMGNRPFKLFKLRSMGVDAEERLAGLLALNQRDGGPLFKLDRDPRVTRVGAIIRATSIDEIPQLFNVLRGEMSLVGPRPALPGEVAEFDEDLLVRQRVRPGVTGLWQVEARDNPSFSAYRYLDVFYVENQSLALDLTILLATVRTVAASCVRAIRRRPRPSADSPSLPTPPSGDEELGLVAS